jgi:hypothetical protein
MNSSCRSGRTGSIVLVAMVLGSLLVYPAARFADAATPSTFVSFTNPNGLAGRPDFLFVTTPECQIGESPPPREVRKIDRSGSNTLFITLDVHLGCHIEHVAVSPGYGTFLPRYVYVTQGRRIIEITPGPASPTKKVVFEFPAGFSDSDNGITFDIFGTWNHDMIVVGSTDISEELFGQVHRFKRATSGCPVSIGAPCLIPTGGPTFPVTL